MEVAKRTTRLVMVKHYESKLDGEKVKLILYRKGERYGVVSHFPGAAVARDYKNGDITCELRTMIENQEYIIDWVSVTVADERYINQLMNLINRKQKDRASIAQSNGAPRLRIVHNV
jgi:hypothetical protein